MPYRPNFPIPNDIHAPLQCLCIQIPNDPTWKSVVAGILYELQYWYNWQRDEAKSGAECAAVWKDLYQQIDWSTMSCCCGGEFAIIYRWTELGVLQQSTDGGTTWTDAPNEDPRNSSTTYPPLEGDDGEDKKCIAATGTTQLIKEQIGDQLTDDMSRYTLDQLIKDWVTTYIQTSNPFQALLTIAANQIFALVIALLRPALTDDVYDQLKCIILAHMEDDASVTGEEWEAIRADITSDISGIAGVFLEHLIYLLGKVGLTNVLRAGYATSGDCDACFDITPVSFYRPVSGFQILDPDDIIDGYAFYTLQSEIGGGENRVTILSGIVEEFPPTAPCVNMEWSIVSGPDPTFRVGYDCSSTPVGPVSGDAYKQVDFSISTGSPLFTVQYKVALGQ